MRRHQSPVHAWWWWEKLLFLYEKKKTTLQNTGNYFFSVTIMYILFFPLCTKYRIVCGMVRFRFLCLWFSEALGDGTVTTYEGARIVFLAEITNLISKLTNSISLLCKTECHSLHIYRFRFIHIY